MDKTHIQQPTELEPLAPLAPITHAECSRFGTKRMLFNRRRSHQNKHVLILHLNGVLGSINLLSGVHAHTGATKGNGGRHSKL